MAVRTPVLVLALILAGLPAWGQSQPYVSEIETDAVGLQPISTGQVSAEMAALYAGPFDPARQIIVARDDDFADALATGALQASGGALFLVPTAGPIPSAIREQIIRLEPFDAIIVGGEAAVGPAVAAELAGLTESPPVRLAGATRIETAIRISEFALGKGAQTAIVARARGTADNPSAGFADSIAAGAWAARTGASIVLSRTDAVPQETLDFLTFEGYEEVIVVGGEAAISDAAFQQLVRAGFNTRRVAGASRTATAIAIAQEGVGFAQNADPRSVILADGESPTAWSAFTASAMSMAGGAPILVTPRGRLAEDTRAYLARGGFRSILCLNVTREVCEEGRSAMGLRPGADFDAALPVETELLGTFDWFAPTGRGEFYDVVGEGCETTAGNGRDHYYSFLVRTAEGVTRILELFESGNAPPGTAGLSVYGGDARTGPTFRENTGVGDLNDAEGVTSVRGTFDEGATFELEVERRSQPCRPFPSEFGDFGSATLGGIQLPSTLARSCAQFVAVGTSRVFSFDGGGRIVWLELISSEDGAQVVFVDASSLETIGTGAPTRSSVDGAFETAQGTLADGTPFSYRLQTVVAQC